MAQARSLPVMREFTETPSYSMMTPCSQNETVFVFHVSFSVKGAEEIKNEDPENIFLRVISKTADESILCK